MNKFSKLLFALLISIGISTIANAQKTAIKVNILSPIVSTASVHIEHAVGPETSIQLGLYYTGANIEETNFKGFGITPEFRYYLSESSIALDGFYIGPFLRYQNLDITLENSTDEAEFTSFGGGVSIGRQWILKERISIDLFGGPKYSSQSLVFTAGSEEDQFNINFFSGFGLRFGATIGVAF